MGLEKVPGAVDPVPEGYGGAVGADLRTQHDHILHLLLRIAEAVADDDRLGDAHDQETDAEDRGADTKRKLGESREFCAQKGEKSVEKDQCDQEQADQSCEAVAGHHEFEEEG